MLLVLYRYDLIVLFELDTLLVIFGFLEVTHTVG